MTDNYTEVADILTNAYEEIDGYDFYRAIFPDNENMGELHTNFSKPNAIYLYKDEKDEGTKRSLRRRIMLNDTWEEDYMSYVERNPLTLCSGLSYRKRANKINNAQRMNALIIDLDGVGERELRTLLLRFGKNPRITRTLPTPTYIVMSGRGLHVYYVFQEPIDLYPNIKVQLKSLKHDLTFRMWEYKSTSQNKEIQYQSINQSFRMVGSINNKYGVVVRAFQTGERVTLDYLNQYAAEQNRVDVNRPFKPSKMTREEAKEAYPEWYQRVIVEKRHQIKKWDIKGKQGYALYEWWIRQIDKIRGGHRYYFLMCLAIYACKCDVPKKKLKADMLNLFEDLKEVEHDNPLTKEDIESALEAYDKEYYNFTIADIDKLTDVRIERNKRNHRKQSDHVKLMNYVRDEINGNKNWRNKDGRPAGSGTKEQLIKDYIQENPSATVTQIASALSVSRPTVYKYMGAKERG